MANERKTEVTNLLEHAQQIGVQLQKDIREAHILLQDLKETVREAKEIQRRIKTVEQLVADRLAEDNEIFRLVDKRRRQMTTEIVQISRLYRAIVSMYNDIIDTGTIKAKQPMKEPDTVDIVKAIFGDDMDIVGILEIPNDNT